MPGLGWTSCLNLILPFRGNEWIVLHSLSLVREVAAEVSLLGTEPPCPKGPECPHECLGWLWGRRQEVLDVAGGVSDETGQAITDKTCKNASVSKWAPFPGRLPVNWQSLAPGPSPERKGLWAAAIPLSTCGSLK